MKKNRYYFLLFFLGSVFFLLSSSHSQRAISEATKVFASSGLVLNQQLAKNGSGLQYRVLELPNSTVYILEIVTNSRYRMGVDIASSLDSLPDFARQSKAIAVINGGFFNVLNGATASYVYKNGKMVGDPIRNNKLMANSRLRPFLAKILNRSEFRYYLCGSKIKYSITNHLTPVPKGCRLLNSLGAGPRILPNFTATDEGFYIQKEGRILRDPLGIYQANARSALGIKANGDLLWVMVAQKINLTGNSGLSLFSLAKFMKDLGVQEAINLDGGSSSSLYFKGVTHYGKIDQDAKYIKRQVKSVLILQDN